MCHFHVQYCARDTLSASASTLPTYSSWKLCCMSLFSLGPWVRETPLHMPVSISVCRVGWISYHHGILKTEMKRTANQFTQREEQVLKTLSRKQVQSVIRLWSSLEPGGQKNNVFWRRIISCLDSYTETTKGEGGRGETTRKEPNTFTHVKFLKVLPSPPKKLLKDVLHQNEGGDRERVRCKIEEARTTTQERKGDSPRRQQRNIPGTAMSQAEKPPIQTEADKRLQERLVKMTLRRLCFGILKEVYRLGEN